MTRSLFRSTIVALFLTALSATPARCDSWFSFLRMGKKKPVEAQTTVSNRADEIDDEDDDGESRPVHAAYEAPGYANVGPSSPAAAATPAGAVAEFSGGCYPAINSSLYPCPRPDVPYEVGQTIITNQAFYPHEMLYAHRYKALYPPYFYQNKCGLACLPFFPKPCLKGTVVTVKYRSCLPWGYCPPSVSTKKCFSNTQFH
jgi:hypothetical protein